MEIHFTSHTPEARILCDVLIGACRDIAERFRLASDPALATEATKALLNPFLSHHHLGMDIDNSDESVQATEVRGAASETLSDGRAHDGDDEGRVMKAGENGVVHETSPTERLEQKDVDDSDMSSDEVIDLTQSDSEETVDAGHEIRDGSRL